MIGKGDHDLFDHNCEHFAILCKTAQFKSTRLNIEGIVARFLRPSRDAIVS